MRISDMKSEKKTGKRQQRRQKNTLKPWLRLQVRMAISYVAVSVAIALLLELLLVLIFFTVITRLPYVNQTVLDAANNTAEIYALEAIVQGGGTTLDPRSTFQPGQPYSLSVPGESSSANNGASTSPSQVIAFALLIAPNGQVVASSDASHYPASASVYRLLPGQAQPLIRNALAGKADYRFVTTLQGNMAYVAQPVWSKYKRPIGAVFVQTSPQQVSGGIFSVVPGLFFTAIFWIIITAPIGTLFGFLTTRGLVRRLQRLVQATAQFAQSDYTQRVKVNKQDEIGQLESQFNQMAGQLVESIAQQQALIEQQARLEERARIEQELRTARYIQLALLPKDVPLLPGWQLVPVYRPAREVGGDFYDFHPLADGRLGIVIGDATDKSVSAALLMATTCTMLRTATQGSISPGEVLGRVNDLLAVTIPTGMFVTCFYAMLDPITGRLWYANAGHDLPYLRHNGGVSELYATGMPLGLMQGISYEEKEAMLEHGDSVLLYSDGLVEAHNKKQDMFSFPYLMSLLKEDVAGKELIDFLLAKLASFTGPDWEQEDDVTLVTLLRKEGDGLSEITTQPVSHNEQMNGNDNWQTLDEWSVPSQPDNERQVMERVAEVVKTLNLSDKQREQLKTAVAEATMNAMEHGNHYQADVPVDIQVLTSKTALAIRIRDKGGSKPIPAANEPDLEAKLAGLQTPRGWGLFLIKNMVDDMHISRDETHRTIELIMYLEGGNHATS
ncbi:MAG TPA: SpoIIE family protein phosphatase [Ktedonobacteraceae bacterium]|nr:SpoIIE family protein phosphatase [Ktedonobacteraceae bacterium]